MLISGASSETQFCLEKNFVFSLYFNAGNGNVNLNTGNGCLHQVFAVAYLQLFSPEIKRKQSQTAVTCETDGLGCLHGHESVCNLLATSCVTAHCWELDWET